MVGCAQGRPTHVLRVEVSPMEVTPRVLVNRKSSLLLYRFFSVSSFGFDTIGGWKFLLMNQVIRDLSLNVVQAVFSPWAWLYLMMLVSL